MPETGIGLIPDVGGTWLLAHAPGETGIYLGLTGEIMRAADAIYARFADSPCLRPAWRADCTLVDPEGGSVEDAIAAFKDRRASHSLARQQPTSIEAFAGSSVEDILRRPRRHAGRVGGEDRARRWRRNRPRP